MKGAPDVGSLWHYPPWTNPSWSGPWRVIGVGRRKTHEWAERVVFLERVDGPPESWQTEPYEASFEHADWPGLWEPWPSVPDFPPSS